MSHVKQGSHCRVSSKSKGIFNTFQPFVIKEFMVNEEGEGIGYSPSGCLGGCGGS